MKIPNFEKPNFQKKKNPYIDQLNNITSINHVIITQSINNTSQFCSNFTQFHKIPKSLKNIRTLISKKFRNHKNFEIKVWESCLDDAWWKTHDSVLIKNPINIKKPQILKMWKSLEKCMKDAWNHVIWWKRKVKSVLP